MIRRLRSLFNLEAALRPLFRALHRRLSEVEPVVERVSAFAPCELCGAVVHVRHDDVVRAVLEDARTREKRVAVACARCAEKFKNRYRLRPMVREGGMAS